MSGKTILLLSCTLGVYSCLPPSDPYPNVDPAMVVAQAELMSDSLENYIYRWTQGLAPGTIPDHLIPEGVSDSKNFYLKHPDSVSASETWAIRYAKPINKDSLYTGIPDPKVTYLFLGTGLAPFGSKMIIEGEFPHCRFFSIQVTPPLNGKEYYAQRQFGTAEVSLVDADIVPLPGHTNPFVVGANRNATNRSYRVEIELTTGDPTSLNNLAHTYPYRQNTNTRKGALWVYQGPLGFKTLANTPLPENQQGMWDLGSLWVRIYEPDANTDALGGVPMPKVYFELPTGEKYFIGSDFSKLQNRADATIANRTVLTQPNPNYGPSVGWFKSWGITRSILNGICLANAWADSTQRVREIDLGWTGRGETQPAPGNIEPHATTNNYVSYLGRTVTVPPGMVAVLTGKMPTFPRTRNGETVMTKGDVRYWSICGIDADPLSPLPATTVHAISDEEVVVDADRNYVIAYSRIADKPANAGEDNGVSWVDWGTQSELGLLVRWLCVAPDWRFDFAPHEHNLDFAHSDWSATQYDKSLIGENWRNGFMKCYSPRIHFLTKAEFEEIGPNVTAENVPVWVDSSFTTPGMSEARLGTVSASSTLDTAVVNRAANLIDGDMSSAWSSAFGQPVQTVTVDLLDKKIISAVKLNWDRIFFAKDYRLLVSDDNLNWTTIANVTNENGAVDLYKNLQGITGRYVKLELSNYNLWYYRLGEFEVYTSDCKCASGTTLSPGFETDRIDLRIYPNPVIDVLNYQTGLEGPAEIQIYQLQGKLCLSQKAGLSGGSIYLGHLPAGVYLLAVTVNGKKPAVKKFVKVE